jgi:Protein of unknown function (DUF559)/AbiEi antitoxin C-terminal domain
MPNAHVPDSLSCAPFTTADAARMGVSQTALRSSPWRRLLRGVWVHQSIEDSRELRLAAVRLVLPERGVACGLTAAWIYGVDVRRRDDLDVYVCFPTGGRIRPRAGMHVCQETLADSDITTIDSLRVTTPVRTAFDCARWLRGVERVVVVDALAHAHLVTLEQIRAYLAGKHRLRNLRRAQDVLALADPLAESPMETRLRILLIEWGLPRPVSQLDVHDQYGSFVGRLDLAFPEVKVAVEYDGALHWEQRRDDDRRRTRLRQQGWVVLVYSATDYYERKQAICQEVTRHLAAAGISVRRPTR